MALRLAKQFSLAFSVAAKCFCSSFFFVSARKYSSLGIFIICYYWHCL